MVSGKLLFSQESNQGLRYFHRALLLEIKTFFLLELDLIISLYLFHCYALLSRQPISLKGECVYMVDDLSSVIKPAREARGPEGPAR